MGTINTITNYLKILRNTQVSPSLRIPQGVQALLLGVLTSFGFTTLLGFSVFDRNAYATYSVGISRASSEAVSLGSIKPSYSGALGVGSDVVTVSSDCSSGYNLYVSAISDGNTNLNLFGASALELEDASNYIPSTTTATGSETVLTKDTWGVGKDGITFSKLPAYTTDIGDLTPIYTGTTGSDYTIYYGVNVSTSKTPGTYTVDVLYTVLMNSSCLEYTLKFDDNRATISNLPAQTIPFGQAVDLSEYSTTDKIAKTGHHLIGWKIEDRDGTLLPTNNNTTIDDGESSELTLTAQWEANSYTISFNGQGGSVATSSVPGIYGEDITTSEASYPGYNLVGWARTAYIAGQGTADYATTDKASLSVTTLASNAGVTNTNSAIISLYAVWQSAVPDCSGSVYPTVSTGCKMKDGNIWILGNSGNTITWNDLCTSSDNCKSTIYCPSGYYIPTFYDYVRLVSSYQSDGISQLYYDLGRGWRSFWSSTQDYTVKSGSDYPSAYRLDASSSNVNISNNYKTTYYYVLCRKQP